MNGPSVLKKYRIFYTKIGVEAFEVEFELKYIPREI